MTFYKKILVAVDTSEEADQVLSIAAKLVEGTGAEIIVQHVTQDISAAYGQWVTYIPPVNKNEVEKEIFTSLEKRVERIGIDSKCIRIDFGRPVDSIIKRSKNEKVDLIVIGSHGRHGVQLLLGSTANGVLHHATCDVYSVRIKE